MNTYCGSVVTDQTKTGPRDLKATLPSVADRHLNIAAIFMSFTLKYIKFKKKKKKIILRSLKQLTDRVTC